MSGEPELHPLTSEPTWVPYLAQLLNYQGYWHGSTSDESFDEALRDAVVAFQNAQGVSPADGVVRASTWHALTTATPAAHAAAAQPAEAHAQPAAGHGMTGHPVQAHPVPATMNVDGVPGTSYSISSEPIAYAEFVTPAGQVELQLSLTGGGTVSFPHGLPITVTPDSFSASVTQAVQGFSHGISVSGLPGENITITDSVSSTYTGSSISFDPSTEAIVFHGEVHGAFDTPSDLGSAHVQGSFGFNLSVRVHGGQPQEQEVPAPVQDTSSFFERHHQALLVLGAVTLIAAGVIVTVATSGAGAPAGEAAGEEGLLMLGTALAE